MPFTVEGRGDGVIALCSARGGHFSARSTELYASVAGLVGVAIAHQSAERVLQDRARELTSLYRIARLVAHPDGALESILRRIVRALPPACPLPSTAFACVSVDGRDYRWPGRVVEGTSLHADIMVRKRKRGVVQVTFEEPAAELADDKTAAGIRRLLRGVARQIAVLLQSLALRAEKETSDAQLRHADRLGTIGMLAAGLAHELNEPLTAVVGFAELVQRDPELPARCWADLDRITAASAHARAIIRRLMVLAKPSTPTLEAVSWREIIEEGLSFVAPRASVARVRVVHQLDAVLPAFSADRTQLVQVVVNLALNAIQAMPDGGVLRIEAGSDPMGVSLVVEDDGIGMDDDVLARVFDPFFTTKREGEGTGLGLVVVHGIVSLHGGTMEVRSVRGAGTRMTVHLPLRRPPFPDLHESARRVAG